MKDRFLHKTMQEKNQVCANQEDQDQNSSEGSLTLIFIVCNITDINVQNLHQHMNGKFLYKTM